MLQKEMLNKSKLLTLAVSLTVSTLLLPAGSKGAPFPGSTIERGQADKQKVDGSRRGRGRKRMILTTEAGIQFDNNAFLYSQGYIDSSGIAEKSYRYPGVQAVGEYLFPLALRMFVDFGPITASVKSSGEVHTRNSVLNTFSTNASLAWDGPVKIRAAYTFIPYHPIRPTYYASRAYEMLSYRENKVDLTAQVRFWRFRPSIRFSLGHYNYNPAFDNYDATFVEGRLGTSIPKPVRLIANVKGGTVIAAHNTGSDWSNGYASLFVDFRVPVRHVSFGTKAFIKDRVYTTKDTIDTHYGRNDFYGSNSLYIIYEWLDFDLLPYAMYSWRATQSTFPVIDEQKDYRGISAGFDVTWKFKI